MMDALHEHAVSFAGMMVVAALTAVIAIELFKNNRMFRCWLFTILASGCFATAILALTNYIHLLFL